MARAHGPHLLRAGKEGGERGAYPLRPPPADKMIKYKHNPALTGTARALRKNMTKEEPEFLDSAQGMLTLSNGAGVVADVSYAIPDGVEFKLPYYWQFFIWGTEGMIAFSLSEKQLQSDGTEKPANYYVKGQVEPIALEDKQGDNYLTDFLRVVKGEKAILPISEVIESTRATLTIQSKA